MVKNISSNVRKRKIPHLNWCLILLYITLFFPTPSLEAWGKKGHEITADTAAWLVAKKQRKPWLYNHAYDLGYYANVPDVIWKNLGEEGYKKESPYHFFDWNKEVKEVFKDQGKIPNTFAAYKKAMSENYKRKTGLLLWRIAELQKRCKSIAENLKKDSQGPLLVCMGALAHYTGDMAQPLHVSDNYDGQLTRQRGIHAYFETVMVNYLDPEIRVSVREKAWEMYKISKSNMSPENLIRLEMKHSFENVQKVLKADKNADRSNLRENAQAHRETIITQLARGAVITALLWEQILEPVSDFSENTFYFFDGAPTHIPADFE